MTPRTSATSGRWAGGGLLDVGVYPLLTGRYVFEADPIRAFAAIERHPEWDVDVLSHAVLQFPSGILTFTCGTLLAVHQHMAIQGTEGRIELPDPFAQSPTREARISILGPRSIWEPLNEEVETLERVKPVRAAGRGVLRGSAGRGAAGIPAGGVDQDDAGGGCARALGRERPVGGGRRLSAGTAGCARCYNEPDQT